MHPSSTTSMLDLTGSLPALDQLELNGNNLASHTSALAFALEQSVLGKATILASNGEIVLPQPLCGKRSRSNSDASSHSSSAASGYNSVFSDIEGTESGYDSQTSVDLTPSSRKSSAGEAAVKQLESLAAWRASISDTSVSDREQGAKRIKDLKGASVRVVVAASHCPPQPDTFKCIPPPASLESDPTAVAASAAPATAVTTFSPTGSSPSEGKNAFVDCLVDAACRTLDAIWNPSATPNSRCDLAQGKSGLPLQVFVRETLRRGRTSCSTLQAALLYCVRLKEAVPTKRKASDPPTERGMGPRDSDCDLDSTGMGKEELCLIACPRRMFLASVMISSKFVQDRTYSNRAWSKISGLPVKELSKIERTFLKAIDYRLVVSENEFESWTLELKRAHHSQAFAAIFSLGGGRSTLSRSQSDNVTGSAVAPDTELRAVSPQVPSQVHPKYRSVESSQEQHTNVCVPDIALPFPMASRDSLARV